MGRHHPLAEIKEMLEACHGAVYVAAEKLEMRPSSLYERIKKSPELQAVRELYRGRLVDAAELKLEQAVKEGQPWAIPFVLKTLGRDRGYVEKQEVETHGRLHVEVEPKAGPELAQAIQRVLDGLAASRPTSLIEDGDKFPESFRTPRALDHR